MRLAMLATEERKAALTIEKGKNTMLEAKEMALIAARALDAKKGKDITVLQIDKITTLADYFVICTGGSNTQINALCDEVEKQLAGLPRKAIAGASIERNGLIVSYPIAAV